LDLSYIPLEAHVYRQSNSTMFPDGPAKTEINMLSALTRA